jgi:hypothetical protein
MLYAPDMGWFQRLFGRRSDERTAQGHPQSIKIIRPGGRTELRAIEPDGRSFDGWVADMEAKSRSGVSGGVRPVKVENIDVASLRKLDLREVPSVRTRIVGAANWVNRRGARPVRSHGVPPRARAG